MPRTGNAVDESVPIPLGTRTRRARPAPAGAPRRRGRGALDEPTDMSRRSTRRKTSPNQQARADLIYPRSLNVLEPGRTRRHAIPRLALMLWGLAIGLASAMSVAGLLA